MKTIKYFTLLLFASTTLLAQTEKRSVSPFDGIHVAGHYDVTLTQGSEGTITLTGNQDDLDKIETYIKKGELIIKQKKTSWFENWNSGKVSINIPVEDINKVILSGSGSIRNQHKLRSEDFKVVLSGSGEIELFLDTDELASVLTGSGDIELRGKATEASYQLTGSGDIKADEMESNLGSAKVTGSGDIELHASSDLTANVTGSGDIICYGNPKKQQIKTTGSGDVIVRD
jgi:hypothetical protein